MCIYLKLFNAFTVCCLWVTHLKFSQDLYSGFCSRPIERSSN